MDFRLRGAALLAPGDRREITLLFRSRFRLETLGGGLAGLRRQGTREAAYVDHVSKCFRRSRLVNLYAPVEFTLRRKCEWIVEQFADLADAAQAFPVVVAGD